MNSISFVKVTSTKKHKDDLFELYKQRRFAISQDPYITKKEHYHFVENHPYRYWFLIYKNTNLVGSLYIHIDNSIGFNLPKINKSLLEKTLRKVYEEFKPLPPKKSVRSKDFFININPNDIAFKKVLYSIDFECFQSSYRLKTKQ